MHLEPNDPQRHKTMYILKTKLPHSVPHTQPKINQNNKLLIQNPNPYRLAMPLGATNTMTLAMDIVTVHLRKWPMLLMNGRR